MRAGANAYDIPLDAVHGVLRAQRLVRAPGTPSTTLGVANVRSAVVPVLSLAALAGEQMALIPTGDDQAARLIMLDGRALAVEEVHGLAWVDAAALQVVDRLLTQASLSAASTNIKLARIAAEPTIRAQATEEGARGAATALASFWIAGQRVAVRLEQLHAALSCTSSNPVIGGGIAYGRGQLPIVNMPEALGALNPSARKSGLAVIRSTGGLFGLHVDRFAEVLRPQAADIDAAGPTLGRRFISHVVRLNDDRSLAAVLDIDALAALAREIMPLLPSEHQTFPASRTPSDADAMGGAERLLVFSAASRRYAAPLGCVEVVLRAPDRLAGAPGARTETIGVLNRRGEVTPVLSLSDGACGRWLVLMRLYGGRLALVVDTLPHLADSAMAPALPGGPSLFPHSVQLQDGGNAPVLDPSAPFAGIPEIAEAFLDTQR